MISTKTLGWMRHGVSYTHNVEVVGFSQDLFEGAYLQNYTSSRFIKCGFIKMSLLRNTFHGTEWLKLAQYRRSVAGPHQHGNHLLGSV
jgi:hypothetical protein